MFLNKRRRSQEKFFRNGKAGQSPTPNDIIDLTTPTTQTAKPEEQKTFDFSTPDRAQAQQNLLPKPNGVQGPPATDQSTQQNQGVPSSDINPKDNPLGIQ